MNAEKLKFAINAKSLMELSRKIMVLELFMS